MTRFTILDQMTMSGRCSSGDQGEYDGLIRVSTRHCQSFTQERKPESTSFRRVAGLEPARKFNLAIVGALGCLEFWSLRRVETTCAMVRRTLSWRHSYLLF